MSQDQPPTPDHRSAPPLGESLGEEAPASLRRASFYPPTSPYDHPSYGAQVTQPDGVPTIRQAQTAMPFARRTLLLFGGGVLSTLLIMGLILTLTHLPFASKPTTKTTKGNVSSTASAIPATTGPGTPPATQPAGVGITGTPGAATSPTAQPTVGKGTAVSLTPTPTIGAWPNHYEGNMQTADGVGYSALDWSNADQVHGEWQLPTSFAAGATGDMSMWVGFNADTTQVGPGSAGGYLVREGVDAIMNGSDVATYTVFWRVQKITAANVQGGSTYSDVAGNTALYQAHAGDQVSLTVWYSGTTVYFDFYDRTTNYGNIRNSYTLPAFKQYSADWRVSHETATLANWNSSSFIMTNCQFMHNGAWVPISYQSYHQLTLTSKSSGGVLATPNYPANGFTSFGMVWLSGS